MARARKKSPTILARLLSPFQGDGASWLAVALLVVAVPLALLAAYKKWGGVITGSGAYLVEAEEIHVAPPQPTWIYGNVKAEVIRDGSLQGLSSLDTDLTRRMIDAFELHPWVESVERLSKAHPNRVHVRLSYRRPIAMVEVFDGQRRWVSPVDRSGYVLPTDGFANKLDQLEDYLRIHVGGNLAPGVAGTLCSDVRVRDAAAVAEVVHSKWKSLGLYRIVALPAAEDYRTPQFALATRERAAVTWGSAPGREEADEAPAAEKLARLLAYVAENGPLDSLPASRALDLRRDSGAAATPRTAQAAQ
jgi:hypothetical protein